MVLVVILEALNMEIINIIVQEALVVMVIIMPQQQLQQLLDMAHQDMLDNIIIRLPPRLLLVCH